LVAYAPFGHWKTTTFLAALRHDRITAPCDFDGPINGAKAFGNLSLNFCFRPRLCENAIGSSGAPICSSSTIGDWSRSTPPPVTTSSKSSRSGYGRRSTIVTSQLPAERWHEIIGDPTYTDAILDRLVHNAHRINLAGESLRRTRVKQNQKA
jgi:IstB-like ATP binding protein